MPGLVTVSLRQKNDARLQQLFCQKHSAVDIPAGNTPSASLLFCHGQQMEKIWHCAPRTLNLSSFTSACWKTFSLPLHFHFFPLPSCFWRKQSHKTSSLDSSHLVFRWLNAAILGCSFHPCVCVYECVHEAAGGSTWTPGIPAGWHESTSGRLDFPRPWNSPYMQSEMSWRILWFSKCSRNSFRVTSQSRLAVQLKVTLSRGPSGSASVERKI